MGVYGWMLIISILIWVVTIFLFKNSYDEWQWDYSNNRKCREKVWHEEDRLTAPLWMYILVAISLFIPMLNGIIAIVALICLISSYIDEKIYLHIELPEQLKFLIKEY